MADGTLDSELFVLLDSWPGVASKPSVACYRDMTSALVGHNQATATYPVGTKWVVYNAPIEGNQVGRVGFSTFVYLQFESTDAPTAAAKQVCVQDSASLWYVVTNDPDSCVCLETAMACILISAMTDAYYGWFWCGGVCPEKYVSGLGGNYATDGAIAAGGALTASDIAADAIGLAPVADDTEPIFAYALGADS